MSQNFGPQNPQGVPYGPQGQPGHPQQPLSQPSAPAPYGAPPGQPSAVPMGQPSAAPMSQPSAVPMGQPGALPAYGAPQGQPSAVPVSQPSAVPMSQPSAVPVGHQGFGGMPPQQPPQMGYQPSYGAPTPPPRKGMSTVMLVGLLVAGLALLGLLGTLGFVLTRPKETPTTPPAPTTTTPAPGPTSTSPAPAPTTTTPAPTPTTTSPSPTQPSTTTTSPSAQGQPLDIGNGVTITVPVGWRAVPKEEDGEKYWIVYAGSDQMLVQTYQVPPGTLATARMDSYAANNARKWTNPKLYPSVAVPLSRPGGTAASGGAEGTSTSGGSSRQVAVNAFMAIRSADGVAFLVATGGPAGNYEKNEPLKRDMLSIFNSGVNTLLK